MYIPPWGIFLWRSYVKLKRMCTWLDGSKEQLQAPRFWKLIYHCDLQSWTWINILAAPIWPSQLEEFCWEVLRLVQRHQLDEEAPDSNRLSRLWLPTRLGAREGWGQLHGQDTEVVMLQFRSYNIVFFPGLILPCWSPWKQGHEIYQNPFCKFADINTVTANKKHFFFSISSYWDGETGRTMILSQVLHPEAENCTGI